MTDRGRGAPGEETPVGDGSGVLHDAAPSAPRLLLQQRITVPELPADYCDRAQLTRRCARPEPHITLVMATGGFGKTTLLAATCRAVRGEGVPVAWLSLASEDGPAELDAYLASAFRCAGVDVPAESTAGPPRVGSPHSRTAALVCALQARTAPCLLALDELENVTDPESVALLTFFLRNPPPCLHLVLGCRKLPVGLDLAIEVFAGGVAVLGPEELRFSRGDIARFFGLKLSRPGLSQAQEESRGWPIALRACGPRERSTTQVVRVVRDVIGNWIEGRFLAGFPEADRELLLDLALCEWWDERLVEEVAEAPGTLARMERMPDLAGLVEPVGAAASGGCQLHPLLREHCAQRRQREAPERYRMLQRRVALAMARRGETVTAMRYATEAGDATLAGRILIEAGGLAYWLRYGASAFIAANRYLTDRVVAAEPRLALARCAALALGGRLREARAALAGLMREPVSISGRDAGFDIDAVLARALLAHDACQPIGSRDTREAMVDAWRIVGLPTADRVVRGAMEYGLCVHQNQHAEFDAALAHGRRARSLAGSSSYLAMAVDFQCGQVAMARGDVAEALKCYRSARRAARARFPEDPRSSVISAVLTRELALERHRVASQPEDERLAWEVHAVGANLGVRAAASDVAVELARERAGTDGALGILDAIWERARADGLVALERHLAARRVALLAEAGRVEEAERTWRAAELPAADDRCLDLELHSWREVEALSCARLSLLTAKHEYAAARRLAGVLTTVAAQRGLRRTSLRVLALSVANEHAAGAPDAALERLVDYLRLYVETDFARPLVRAGEPAAASLERFLDTQPGPALAQAAEGLLAMVQGGGAVVVPRFRGAQEKVLLRLATQQDKDIAAALGLSRHGVRYHIRNIFRKLEVGDRTAAVRRARALGILPPAP